MRLADSYHAEIVLADPWMNGCDTNQCWSLNLRFAHYSFDLGFITII